MDEIGQEIDDIQNNIEISLKEMNISNVKASRLNSYFDVKKPQMPYTFNTNQIPPPPPPPEEEYIAAYNIVTQPAHPPEPNIQSNIPPYNYPYDSNIIKSEYDAENELQGAKYYIFIYRHLLKVLQSKIKPTTISKSYKKSQKKSVSKIKKSINKPKLVEYEKINYPERSPHIISKTKEPISSNNINQKIKKTPQKVTNNFIYIDPRKSIPMLPRPRKRTQPTILYVQK